ncbi:nicotinate-nucleotide adenylyltransferase [Teredinibacter haidensis]|uniref:nicotinate-nucleotide adenylyltransferase n=1 Tax=Teredinibacter haidensis TaxID=2731755 RepID=UPI000948F2BA|nr:nicotinate-nucleotide adenylyltransferase [Teredinibacter haidensis]
MPDTVVLFGGSFDPVHRGHLQAADEAAQQLGVDKVCLLPCHIPPHKATLKAKPRQRAEMLELAVAEYPRLAIDTWELQQHKPSYTLETLKRYRRELGDSACVIFLMGWDSLQSLPSWYHWRELENLTHFAVWRRPGYCELSPQVLEWLSSREMAIDQIKQRSSGGVCFLQTTPNDVSSTHLRQVVDLDDPAALLIPPAVRRYIYEHKLYTQ